MAVPCRGADSISTLPAINAARSCIPVKAKPLLRISLIFGAKFYSVVFNNQLPDKPSKSTCPAFSGFFTFKFNNTVAFFEKSFFESKFTVFEEMPTAADYVSDF